MLYVMYFMLFLFFFKQKTAYEMRISDWSSDVCSSDLSSAQPDFHLVLSYRAAILSLMRGDDMQMPYAVEAQGLVKDFGSFRAVNGIDIAVPTGSIYRSEEHTSELQSLMRISYAVFCLKKKKHSINVSNDRLQSHSR